MYRLHTSFSLFSNLIVSNKNSRSLCSSCSFVGYLTSALRMYPLSLPSSLFSINFASNPNLSFFLLWHCSSLHIFHVPILEKWRHFVPVISSHAFVIYFCMLWTAWCVLLIPFSTINSISTPVKNSNSTFVFFKHAYHDNLGAERKQAGSGLCISIHWFGSFQIHLPVIMYSSVMYKSSYWPRCFVPKSSKILFVCLQSASVISSIFRLP